MAEHHGLEVRAVAGKGLRRRAFGGFTWGYDLGLWGFGGGGGGQFSGCWAF